MSGRGKDLFPMHVQEKIHAAGAINDIFVVVVSLGALVEAGSFPDLLLLDPRSIPADVFLYHSSDPSREDLVLEDDWLGTEKDGSTMAVTGIGLVIFDRLFICASSSTLAPSTICPLQRHCHWSSSSDDESERGGEL
ncbi:hypothetical protein Tco_0960801 [Tanacetum coccineum]